ncbi:CheR family methyltransferase [Desulfatibacillum aliphaticivorans]|uniref:CheR family methyltransferase n=1 Tax=Desulfatibacillum aliphaticivorans TaxID=218208 RepID=UPI00041C9051|nr:CheR family methyltransferase [Desulfatibacillum aliphaticivorans]
MIPVLSETEFELFRTLLQNKTGILLKAARRQTLGRRLAKRMEALGMSSYTAYYRMLKAGKNDEELRALINHVTIDQTSFFRAGPQFDLLAGRIIPEIMQKNYGLKQMRIWSAGCSRGHEPYSVAMMLQQAVRELVSWDVKILATDIDSDSLKYAFRGRYTANEMSHVPEDYATRFFKPQRHGGKKLYAVKDGLRKHILFRRLNLLESPYPIKGPMDVILCRNVMIYFSRTQKQQIMGEFLRLLPIGGYLCLGASESLIGIDDRFSLIGHAVYQKQKN